MILKNNTQGNFTIISNVILTDKTLSITDRGLLCTLISLPDGWDFTVSGMASILPDGKDKIKSSLNRLANRGYLSISQQRESGKFSSNELHINIPPVLPQTIEPDLSSRRPVAADFDTMPFKEIPLTENPPTVTPTSEKSLTRNPIQYNKHKENTKSSKTNISNNNDGEPNVVVCDYPELDELNLKNSEKACVIDAASGDKQRIHQAIRVLRSSSNVHNVPGFLITAIKENWKAVPVTRQKGMVPLSPEAKDKYLSSAGVNSMDELERILLCRNQPPALTA